MTGAGAASRRRVLGLSHFIGETSEEFDWTLTLDVPADKRQILNNQGAESVTLFLTEEHGLPVEWIRHRPQGPLAEKRPKIRLGDDAVTVGVPDPEASGALLESLGFERSDSSWVLRSRLFRSLSLRLDRDPDEAPRPKVDDKGLTSISLLVKDLDAVAKTLPLLAHQEFSLDGVTKEIAFFSGEGLLLEFLMVKRRSREGPR
jgi:hypothetical protein